MDKDNSNGVELEPLKNGTDTEAGADETDKSAPPKEDTVVLVENEDDDSDRESTKSSDSAEETCNKIWDDAFKKLAKADGEDDGKIELKSLVKWIQSLDLNSRIEYESHLDISPNQIERIVRNVSVYLILKAQG